MKAPFRWRPGPGLLVAAAFLGPGTVATASRAGSEYGFALLWTLLFAVGAAIALQEMAARLGVVARRGLAEAIRDSIRPAWARWAALALVLTAIVLGNTAYQTGNLTGAGAGLEAVTGIRPRTTAAVTGVAIAGLLAFGGDGRRLRNTLIAFVLAMSAAFVATAVAVGPDPGELAAGFLPSSLTDDALLTGLALLGTTVVPYNLFLHATAARNAWAEEQDVSRSLIAARLDTIVAVGLGGLVTMAIVVTAAAAFHGQESPPNTAAALAEQLGPLLGPAGKWLFALGLAAAGLTSAVTAPLAAGYAAAGALGGGDKTVRWVAASVSLIGAGVAVAYGEKSPQQTIIVAQAANGLLLPLVAAFLLTVMNRADLLGEHRNRWLMNAVGGSVLLVALVLGARTIGSLL